MFTQQDLDEAVTAGALSADAAASLRSFVGTRSATPSVDEEQFRLVNSFNDIFVSIASAILLFAVGWIGQSIGVSLGLGLPNGGPSLVAPAAVAATAWGLATVFTGRRRMALPSILLLLAFVGGVVATVGASLGLVVGNDPSKVVASAVGAISAAAGAGAAWLHWRQFKVPITIAAGAAAVAGVLLALLLAALGDRVDDPKQLILGFTLVMGVGMFLFAMSWDASDPARVTRRSDVAFWIHLLAAPMIVHPIFTLLGLNDGSASIGEGLTVVALYVAFGVTALAIDRRALLVSALAYVLYALSALFKQFGAVQLNVALTALVIGSALLMLSAYWHQARKLVVKLLPVPLQSKLPLLDRPSLQPTA